MSTYFVSIVTLGRVQPALTRGTKGRYLAVLPRRPGLTVTPAASAHADRRRLYVETSAYLCMLLAEDGADRLSAETRGAELLSSVLLVLEAKRNLVRLARDGVLTPAQYRACRDRVEDDRQLFVRST